MKPETAQQILQTAQDMDLEIRLYKNYSGRAMYGKTTTGLVGNQTDILEATIQTAYLLGREEGETSTYDPPDHDEGLLITTGLNNTLEKQQAAEKLAETTHREAIDKANNFLNDLKWRWDNMGRDDMIAY